MLLRLVVVKGVMSITIPFVERFIYYGSRFDVINSLLDSFLELLYAYAYTPFFIKFVLTIFSIYFIYRFICKLKQGEMGKHKGFISSMLLKSLWGGVVILCLSFITIFGVERVLIMSGPDIYTGSGYEINANRSYRVEDLISDLEKGMEYRKEVSAMKEVWDNLYDVSYDLFGAIDFTITSGKKVYIDIDKEYLARKNIQNESQMVEISLVLAEGFLEHEDVSHHLGSPGPYYTYAEPLYERSFIFDWYAGENKEPYKYEYSIVDYKQVELVDDSDEQ